MKIGADEIILWLRKDGHAKGINNKELGKRICELVSSLGGKKLGEERVYWSVVEHEHISDIELPKTAEQYELDIERLSSLYRKLI